MIYDGDFDVNKLIFVGLVVSELAQYMIRPL